MPPALRRLSCGLAPCSPSHPRLPCAWQMVDQQLALSVYLRAKPAAHNKVIQCFMETGQFDKIMVYCQKVSYTADWGFLLTNIVRVNPAGALEFAQKLASAEVRPPPPPPPPPSLAPASHCPPRRAALTAVPPLAPPLTPSRASSRARA